ncbi:hypothetical protein BKA83DRAFT_4492174 [Pisolithus microcarpus]|nr:hypothetical protein BKA83DRAFT_4492174 [Pisolithus microcarpus]
MVPEVPSTSSTPDPFVSQATSTTVSGSSKGTTEKSYFKPSQTEHNDLSEPRSGEESCDSNDGPWSSLDDAGDVQDAEDEASCGRAGSNDVPDSDHMSENAGPHELDDELGQGGQTPSPQVHSQQSSSQQRFPQPRVRTQSIVSSQHAPSQQYVPRHAVSSQSGPAPAQRPVLQQSRLSQPQVAPKCAPAPPPPHCPNQRGESISSHQSGMLQDRGVRSNNGPQMQHGEEVGMDYDVNARHQSRNRRPCPPSPTYLEDTVSGEKHPSKKLCSNVVSQVQVSAACKLLGEAKARMRLYVATEVPFLRHEMVIDGVCMEILVEMVIKYKDDGLELEAGFYPEHKRSMVTILFNNTQTFRSEIKKVAVHIVPFEYGLYPPETIDDNAERIDFVKKKATQLLEILQGRTSNFAHSALKKTCLAVYYCTSSKSLRRFAEFQESVPVKALALVAAIIRSVLTTFKKHGVAKNETLCGDEIEEACNNITHLIDQVWYDDYHGSKLNKMLQEWAKAGMTGYSAREIARPETEEWQVILD